MTDRRKSNYCKKSMVRINTCAAAVFLSEEIKKQGVVKGTVRLDNAVE
jgi:hypothetical protein